jgi:hypothetical protein
MGKIKEENGKGDMMRKPVDMSAFGGKTYTVYRKVKNAKIIKNSIYQPVGVYFKREASKLLKLDKDYVAFEVKTGKLLSRKHLKRVI